jgi:Ran GTPase-activating protein (RanGAP) involved in mRNA processing and transport
MNMKRFLSDSFRREIDTRIDRLIVNHKVNLTQRSGEFFDLDAGGHESGVGLGADGPNITALHAAAIYQEKCVDLKLDATPNAEKRFVEQFLNSIHRHSLRFSGLGLGPHCVFCLVELLRANPTIRCLDLSLNRLADEGASIIGDFFKANGGLISIDLRSNGIGIPGCVAIFSGLRANSHVTTVDLSAVDGIDRNRVGTLGCQALAAVLGCNRVLSHLNVAMCGITADGCLALSNCLIRNTALLALDLTANRFGSVGTMNLFQKDGAFGQLTSLFIARNAIGDDASGAICRQLEISKALRALDVSGNHLGQVFVRRLLLAFQNGAKLRTLNLAKNRLGPECEEVLNQLLREFPTIQHLNLANNVFKDRALITMAEGFKQNTTLLTLDLSGVGMMDGAASAWAAAIGENQFLQRFYVVGNKITDVGGVLLGKALAQNKSLVIFSLRNNELKDDTADALLEAIAVNNTVSDIDVTYNDFSYRSYIKLTQTIEEHKRTLNSNIAEVAGRHIEWLKDEERRLFDYRAQIKQQQEAVESITGTRDLKRVELQNLKQRTQEETNEIQANLDEIRAKYDEISEERRVQQQAYNDAKLQLELKQSAASQTFQTLAAKRQSAHTRLLRAEAKKKETFEGNAKRINDLKQQLNDLREQLQATIEETLEAKKALLESEERQKEEERLAALAANPEEAPKKGKRKKSPKGPKKAKEAPLARQLASDVVQPPGEAEAPAPKPAAPKGKARPQTSLAKTRSTK